MGGIIAVVPDKSNSVFPWPSQSGMSRQAKFISPSTGRPYAAVLAPPNEVVTYDAGRGNRGQSVAGKRTRSTGEAASENGKLDADAWTDAALTELAAHGIDGVRVEVLAKRLKVTKGSFYYHFRNRDTLLVMMLERWRRRATLALIERLDRGMASPAERLRELLRLPLKGERAAFAADTELAIRLWGRNDPRARSALEEVDQLRLQYIAGLMTETGIAPEEARARAILAYAYQRVGATLTDPSAPELARQCEALLMGAQPLA